MKPCRVVLPILCLAVCSLSTLGQQFTAMSGRIKDVNGAAVSGARVTLTAADTRASRTATTDETGAYQFRQLRPGLYSLRVESAGFKTFAQERMELLVATPTTLDVTLQPGAINEQVVISEQAASGVNTQDASAGNPLNERAIKNLPILARNPVTLLTLQPGVVFTGESDTDRLSQGANKNLDDREGFVNGLRANQTNVTVDGANANGFETQAAFSSTLPVTLDSLQEFRVTTAGASATEGVAGAAQVQLVTKSGSNSFHGNLREYHRNTATSANSYFNNLAGIEKPKLLRNIFGGSLGARLRRVAQQQQRLCHGLDRCLHFALRQFIPLRADAARNRGDWRGGRILQRHPRHAVLPRRGRKHWLSSRPERPPRSDPRAQLRRDADGGRARATGARASSPKTASSFTRNTPGESGRI